MGRQQQLSSTASWLLFMVLVAPMVAGCGYSSCPRGEAGMLNVHLVAHSHDDVGWLKTADQYFLGANRKGWEGWEENQRAGVQYILDTAFLELAMHPQRRYIQVETSFFWSWWVEQDSDTQDLVTQLVESGQLEMVGGGWSMNDEGATHYAAIIDQMSLGLQFLNSTFGDCGRPRIGWQIDPFGHSKEQASILANMGYHGLFFGRLDWRDKTKREETLTMEMVWQASEDLGPASDLFTGVLFNNYGPPDGFCWDLLCNDAPLMDNPLLETNMEERIAAFLHYVQRQAKYYRSDNIMLTMGMDFHYQAAHAWFINLDKLIHTVNGLQANGSKVNVFYSTPSCYLKALEESGLVWPVKTDDFFPYASDPHAYWSGYFTSRPTSKRLIREAEIYAQHLARLTVIRKEPRHVVEQLDKLRHTVGIVQHHDAITGTEKQHVANDYHKRIHAALVEAAAALNLSLDSGQPLNLNNQYVICTLLNMSQCNAADAFLDVGPIELSVKNPLGWTRRHHAVRVPLADGDYVVEHGAGRAVPSQLVALPSWVRQLPGRLSNATHELVFAVADLPPLDEALFTLRRVSVKKRARKGREILSSGKKKLSLDTVTSRIKVDPATGALHITDKSTGKETLLQYQLMYYPGHRGNNSEFEFRASGAYIFRPETEEPVSLGSPLEVNLISGPVVDELHLQYNASWVHLIVRTYKQSVDFIEFDWTVGPIPINDGVGKEVILRYSTDIANNGVFYTDANGRQLMQRIRNFRPTYEINGTEPTAQNYYPVNAKIVIEDDNEQLVVLTDRSQGGSSLLDGTVELMLHRRLLDDDAFGVGEALNEQDFGTGLVARGRHRVFLTTDKAASVAAHRAGAIELFFEPLIVLYNQQVGRPLSAGGWVGMTGPLPPNLHLLSLERVYPAHDPFGDYVLVRLEHIYQGGEHPDYSVPVEVDLTTLFTGLSVEWVGETGLAGNIWKEDMDRLQFKAECNSIPPVEATTTGHKDARQEPNWIVSLSPMQIRTFIMKVVYN